ncbi:MAG TPA: NADH-quinone oxidoreductase subunit J [Opitutaceae bacterium]|nr:NADH-quinone oxidoreductase subunit J [Opitutaceae bacterium]
MNLTLAIISVLILGSAAVAVSLRNLIHSALLLIASWAGVAVFYLWAGAEFVAFAQLLVYVGAISMIVLFAVLLTRHSRSELTVAAPALSRAIAAILAGGAVFCVLASAVLKTDFAARPAAAVPPTITVRELGTQLMLSHSAAVLVVGVLLTVALLGAIVLAASDDSKKGDAP